MSWIRDMLLHNSYAITQSTHSLKQYCCVEWGRHTGDRADNADNRAKSSIYLAAGGAGINTDSGEW